MNLIIYFLLLLSPSHPTFEELEIEYRKNTFVAIVEIKEPDHPFIGLKSIQVYKNHFLDASLFEPNDKYLLEEGERYLIFASQCNSNQKVYCLSNTIQPIPVSKINMEMYRLLNSKPCINVNETLVERKKANPYIVMSACHSNQMLELCGCNGKLYHSECEMHNDGVMQYRKGKCE